MWHKGFQTAMHFGWKSLRIERYRTVPSKNPESVQIPGSRCLFLNSTYMYPKLSFRRSLNNELETDDLQEKKLAGIQEGCSVCQ